MARSNLELLLLNQQARAHKPLVRLVSMLHEETMMIQNIEHEIEAKQREVERMRQALQNRILKKNQVVLDASMLIVDMNHAGEARRLHVHHIFIEGGEHDEQARRLRANAHEVSRMLEFIYCTDNVGEVPIRAIEEVEVMVANHRNGGQQALDD